MSRADIPQKSSVADTSPALRPFALHIVVTGGQAEDRAQHPYRPEVTMHIHEAEGHRLAVPKMSAAFFGCRARSVPLGLAALLATRSAQPVHLSVEHRVQRFLDSAAHHLAEVILDAASSIWIT